MTNKLKKGILLKIDDKLETLQLRLMLNKATIIQKDNMSSSLKEAIEFYQSINTQNNQAHRVIKECNDTIQKLLLLKKHSTHLSIDHIINLYNNYEKIPIENFEQALVLNKIDL
ncbi:MAG TPA: hypothetical protein ENJ53_08580 [Phaeodactylibacter sp.]|nr:hypothetical protein [Phaeodactylibacter sp.]